VTHRLLCSAFVGIAAVTLTCAGLLKLADPFQAAGVLAQLLDAPFTKATLLVRLLGALEALTGLALMVYWCSRPVAILGTAVVGANLATAIYLQVQGLLGQCGCFGPLALPGGAVFHFSILAVSGIALVAHARRLQEGAHA